MNNVIRHIDRTVEMLNEHIERYKKKGPGHSIPAMVIWYEDRAKTTAYEIQELEFIKQLIQKEQAYQQEWKEFYQ